MEVRKAPQGGVEGAQSCGANRQRGCATGRRAAQQHGTWKGLGLRWLFPRTAAASLKQVDARKRYGLNLNCADRMLLELSSLAEELPLVDAQKACYGCQLSLIGPHLTYSRQAAVGQHTGRHVGG